MRVTSVVVGLFAVAASAQSSTGTDVATTSMASQTSPMSTATATTTNSADAAASSAAAATQQCLDNCDPSDNSCRASCIAVPSPDNQNVNATTECVAACPQGNGTTTDNANYADCVDGCIAQYYYASTGTPDLATSSGSNSGSGSGSASVTEIKTTMTSGGSTFTTSVPSTVAGDDNASASASGTAAPSSTQPAAAGAMYAPVGSGLGLCGLLAGFLAL
ncbi:hypothetical protein F5Y15DRAFT_394742 [Xylariaceae sp. FL0016]|nr:hypothetical protein F5Y15DRAFT_394742 [Xylariaceae sp. FL0016]